MGTKGQFVRRMTTREFYFQITKEMIDSTQLFIQLSNSSTYYLNERSYDVEHLKKYRFVGRIIGKALIDECLIETNFPRFLYKMITAEDLTFSDLKDLDQTLFNHLNGFLNDDVAGD